MLDSTDARLLKAIQKNAQLTAQELGEILHLSSSQASRRRQRLEAAGYITGYRAQLSPSKLGLHVEAFIQVTTATHAPQIAASFMAHLQTLLPHQAVARVHSQIVMDKIKADAPLPVAPA